MKRKFSTIKSHYLNNKKEKKEFYFCIVFDFEYLCKSLRCTQQLENKLFIALGKINSRNEKTFSFYSFGGDDNHSSCTREPNRI